MRVRALAILSTLLGGWIAFFGAAQAGARQTPLETPSPFLVTRWTTENGLPQNSVTSIVQTPDGYLWVGTFGGLARFDGVRFTIFNSGNTPTLVSNRIRVLHVGRSGTLWIGAETGEVTRFRDGSFSLFARFTAGAYNNQVISTIHEDRDGSLWVGTQASGVTRFVAGDPARAEIYGERQGLPPSLLKNVCEDRDGNLWVCLADGLALFEPGQPGSRGSAARFTLQFKSIAPDLLVSAHPHPDDGLWVLTETSVSQFQQGRLTPRLKYPRNSIQFPPVSRTAEGDFLFSYNTNSLFQLKRTSGAVIEHHPADANKMEQTQPFSIYSLCTDREGNIWAGTIGDGLWRLSRRRVTMLQPVNWDQTAGGGPVLESGPDNLWLGTTHGLFRLAAGVLTAHFTRNYLDDRNEWRVDSMYQDQSGDVWFGITQGVARYRDGRFTQYRLPGIQRIQSIGGDRQGRLWLGTLDGLVRFHDGKVFRQTDGLVNDDVRFIQEDRAGALWIGTPQGLSRFQNGGFTNYTMEQGLSNNFVRAVHEDADGTLWIGTYGGGLNRIRPPDYARIAHITTKHGLPDDFISRILEGDDDTFWLLGNRGVFQVKRSTLHQVADGHRQSLSCVVYDKSDGMDPSEGQGGFQPAGWRARDGKFYFPTIRGLAIIDPSLTNKLAPPVIIERVLLEGLELDARRLIEIPPGKGNLEIQYTALNLAKSEQLQFSFRLSGLNDEWEDVGRRRTAYFPQLEPGDYRFSVRALSPDGVWSEGEANLFFIVRPPWWRTIWFRLLAVMALGGMALTIYRSRVAIYRARAERQEAFSRALMAAQERERRRIAAELHDGLGQSLVIIQRRGRLCLEDDNDPEAMREQVEEIVEASGEALEEVRAMIFDLRPRQLDELGLTGAVADLLSRAVGVNGWQLAKQLDRVDGLLAKESENNLFRIVQESLNNISKHAAATAVSVSLTRRANGVELTVTDNGRGFTQEASAATRAGHGFGLRNIHERARLLGGQVRIESAPGKGSTLRVNVPYNYANLT